MTTPDKDQGGTAAAIPCKAFRTLDGSDFDWKAISSDEQLKDCLLELARALETGDHMAEWFRHQGFDRVTFHSTGVPGRKLVEAGWTPEKHKHIRPYSTLWFNMTDWLNYAYAFTCSVEYRDGHPIKTHAGFLFK